MNTKNKKNPDNWTQEERDRVVGLFDLLLKMDKKQNPDKYKNKKTKEQHIILDKDGDEVIL